MSNPAGTYFDGSYDDPVTHGPLISRMDPITRSMLFKQKYHQRADKFKPLAIGSKGPEGTGSQLVEESEPGDSGIGGVVEWERVFAVKPGSRIERQPYVHNYQLIIDSEIAQVAIPVASTVTFEYFETADGSGVNALKAARWLKFGSVLYYFGGSEPSSDGSGIAEDSSVKRWMGNIWERATRRVPALSLTAS